MLKNRYLSIFAVAALVGLAACGGGESTEGEATVEPTPAVDATAPAAEPAAPMPVDSMGATTAPAPMTGSDSMAAGTSTTTTTTTTDSTAH
ncbi:MAG TPA: hypothetical protein VF263_19845 [Longimicrobiaceae bacterium]